jgi:hypothetical protein
MAAQYSRSESERKGGGGVGVEGDERVSVPLYLYEMAMDERCY